MQIKSSVSQFTTTNGTNIVNENLNISLSHTYYKDYTRPSTSDQNPLPSIRFKINNKIIYWVYPDTSTRDIDFDSLESVDSRIIEDPYWDISLEEPNRHFIRFGINEDVDAANAEDIWNIGGVYPYPTSAVLLNVSSSSSSDSPIGGGAIALAILGLDANYDMIQEVVVLNGTTNVSTNQPFLRVFDLIVLSAGSNGSNIGDITVRNASNNDILGGVDVGKNNSSMAMFTVPRGKTALIVFGNSFINKPNGQVRQANFIFKVRPENGVFGTSLEYLLSDDTQFYFTPKGGMRIPEKSDIKIMADNTSTNNCSVSAVFEIILFDN